MSILTGSSILITGGTGLSGKAFPRVSGDDQDWVVEALSKSLG